MDMGMMWLGMTVVLAVRIFGLIAARWLTGREERPRRDTVVAILVAMPPGAWIQERRPDGTTLTVSRRPETSHASISPSLSSPVPSISEAMHARISSTDA
jgi:hypothetical protein